MKINIILLLRMQHKLFMILYSTSPLKESHAIQNARRILKYKFHSEKYVWMAKLHFSRIMHAARAARAARQQYTNSRRDATLVISNIVN